MIDFLRSSKAHIFVEDLTDSLQVCGEDHHHLSRVLRIQKKDIISAASNGNVRKYIVRKIDKTQIELESEGLEFKIDEKEITLAVSLIKLDRLEWGIAKAVELGATKIIVGNTLRSPLVFNDASQIKFENRIQTIVRSSSMQSRRSNLAQVQVVPNLFEYLNAQSQNLIFCDPDGLTNVDLKNKMIVIGPEGGFESQELQSLDNPYELWKIAPNILRAETAISLATGLANLGSNLSKG